MTTSCPATASSISSLRCPSALLEAHLFMGMRIPRLEVPQGNAESFRDAVTNIFEKILRMDQLRGSWNLLLSWLRDVQAWSLAAEVGE